MNLDDDFEATVCKHMFFLRNDENKHYFVFHKIKLDIYFRNEWVAGLFKRETDRNGNWYVSLAGGKHVIVLHPGDQIRMKKNLYTPGEGFWGTKIIPIAVFIKHSDYRLLNSGYRRHLDHFLELEKKFKIKPAEPPAPSVQPAARNAPLSNVQPVPNERNEQETSPSFQLEEALNEIVGLAGIKEFLYTLHAHIRISNERLKFGLPVAKQSLHMVFTGNPGTGKTTVARVVSNMLYQLGILETNKLVEVDRSGLVAEYLGQTAIKTKETVMSALGGVLFIDEAYALHHGDDDPYGKEAVDTLVKLMEDHRDQIVIILAGYGNEMLDFLKVNPGLSSRFPERLQIHFPDYTSDELLAIALRYYNEHQYIVTEGAQQSIGKRIAQAKIHDDFGNGRFARNLYEDSLRQQALRLSKHTNLTKQLLLTITEEDIR